MTLPNPPYIGNQIPNQPFYSPETPATFDRLSGVLTPNIQLDPNPSTLGGNGWVRPADWLPMPDVSPTEEKFVGLFAVYDLPENFVAVYFEGDYIVDWGDNNTSFMLSGMKAQHSYDWDSIPESTLTSEGYKQVLVTVTPYPGDNLEAMDLTVRHDYLSTCLSSPPWLDIKVSMPQASTGASIIFTGEYVGQGCGYLNLVERIHIVNCGEMTDVSGLFAYLPSLISVPLFDTSKVEIFEGMFTGSSAIKVIPSFNTPLATSMRRMFGGCSSLTTVPYMNTNSVQDMTQMFSGCYSLTFLPAFSVPLVSVFNDLFGYYGAPCLQSAPFTNISSNISFEGCLLGRQAIVDIFNGLANASATIDVRNNYGAADLTAEDLAIATDKGWTVLS